MSPIRWNHRAAATPYQLCGGSLQSSVIAGTVYKRTVAQPSVREIKSGTPIPVALVASTVYSQTEITSEPVEPILDPRIRSGWLFVGDTGL